MKSTVLVEVLDSVSYNVFASTDLSNHSNLFHLRYCVFVCSLLVSIVYNTYVYCV